LFIFIDSEEFEANCDDTETVLEDFEDPYPDIGPLNTEPDLLVKKELFECCYWENIPSDAAKEILLNKPVGTYLTRWSESRGKFCISSHIKKSNVKHYVISENSQKKFAILSLDIWFDSKDSLIEYHADTIKCLYPLTRQQNSKEDFAEEFDLRNFQQVGPLILEK
jgi:hypothetical protein